MYTHIGRGKAKDNECVCRVLFDNSSGECNECDNALKQELNEAQVRRVATKVLQLRMRKRCEPLTVTLDKASRQYFNLQGVLINNCLMTRETCSNLSWKEMSMM